MIMDNNNVFQDLIAEAVKRREVFRDYLQKVVEVEGGVKNR